MLLQNAIYHFASNQTLTKCLYTVLMVSCMWHLFTFLNDHAFIKIIEKILVEKPIYIDKTLVE